MRYLALFVGVWLSGAVVAADDLTILHPDPKGGSPRKLLHTYLLAECGKHFAARKAEVEKLKTATDVATRQKALRAAFIEALGGFPAKTPLNAKTVGTLKRDGYTIEKVIYESRPNHHVTANLYIPAGKGPFPGVLMPLGHSQTGKAAEYMQRGAILLAKNGLAALVYDPIGQGERSQLLDRVGNPAIKGSTSEHTMCGIGAILVGRGTASYRIWDGIRSLDYLASRPEIDARKLGCTGCSGGGTLTSYLMALDDRILAAAPSCYLTSFERLFATIGPQDAEQNITGQVALHLDHADYIFLRAPRPTIVLASTRDFFDIQGTWATFREAKQIYTLLGMPEKLDIVEANATHGYPKSHREAMARFMCRWLRGEDRVVIEENWPIEKVTELRCTRSGQVLDDLRGKSVFDVNWEQAAEYAKQRAGKKHTAEELRKAVSLAIGLPGEIPSMKATEVGALDRTRFVINKRLFTTGAGVPVPAAIYEPKAEHPAAPLVILAHDLGSAATATEAARRAGGRRVMTVDLRGFGETAPAVVTGKLPPFGVEYKETFLALHLNRPLLGQRTSDLLGVIRSAAPKSLGVELTGYGAAAAVVLHAAALDSRVQGITLDGGLVSWQNVVRTPVSHNQLASVVPGVLQVYDLPELAASLTPRPLTIRNPVDAAGKPLSKDAAEAAYTVVREAYRKASAEGRFLLIVDAK